VQAPDVLGFSCALLPADHLRFFSLVRSGKEHRGVDLISDVPAIRSLVVRRTGRSQQRNRITRSSTTAPMMAVIRVYDEVGNVIQTHEHAAQFQGAVNRPCYRFHSLFPWL
jgi:hypothetical protein